MQQGTDTNRAATVKNDTPNISVSPLEVILLEEIRKRLEVWAPWLDPRSWSLNVFLTVEGESCSCGRAGLLLPSLAPNAGGPAQPGISRSTRLLCALVHLYGASRMQLNSYRSLHSWELRYLRHKKGITGCISRSGETFLKHSQIILFTFMGSEDVGAVHLKWCWLSGFLIACVIAEAGRREGETSLPIPDSEQ